LDFIRLDFLDSEKVETRKWLNVDNKPERKPHIRSIRFPLIFMEEGDVAEGEKNTLALSTETKLTNASA
jgi:hypothetical protein